MTWLQRSGHFLIWSILFIIPLAWSRYVNANYVTTKFFLVYVVSGLTLFLSTQKLVKPNWPRALEFLVIGVFLLQLLSPLFHWRVTDYYFTFKFLSLVFLSYYFFQLNIDLKESIKKYSHFIFFLCALISFFSLKSFYEIRIEKMDLQSGLLLGTFGNVNMVAEFLILTFPFLIYWRHITCKTPEWAKLLIIFVWSFMIFYCRSRSAWIGFGLVFAAGVFLKQFKKADYLVLFLALMAYLGAIYLPSVPSPELAIKQTSFANRLGLYISTLRLIFDYPLGIGLGQFSNEIVPYLMNTSISPNEYVYYDQPHSEWLKWAVQFGWLGFIVPLAILFFVVKQIIKVRSYFLGLTLLALLPQLSFQFPFENPASITYLSFIFAMLFLSYGIKETIDLNLKKRFGFFILGLIAVVHGFVFVTSVFFETSNERKTELVSYPCLVYPVNLNGCFIRLQFFMQTRKLIESRWAFEEDFKRFYFHSGHMRLLPAYLSERGLQREACEGALLYSYIFKEQKFFPAETLKNCRALPDPVTFHSPKQFRNDVINWQQKALERATRN